MHDFNNKTFRLLKNSELGEVDSETEFRYSQTGDVVSADYSGGTVKKGKILAIHKGDHLDMVYHCVTTEDMLKAGKAIAQISVQPNGKLMLSLNWEWVNGDQGKGTSTYLEV